MKKKKLVFGILIILLLIVIAMVVNRKASSDYVVEIIDKYDYFILKVDGKSGVIDNKGNIIIEAKYDNVIIPNPKKDVFLCGEVVLNKENKEIFEKYDISAIKLENIATPFIYEKSCLVYAEDSKYGLIDFNGKKLTKPIFDKIETLKYKEGEMIVTEKGKKGVVNLNGKYIVKPEYDTIDIDKMYKKEKKYKDAGYIVGMKTEDGYRYGYVDNSGKEIIECKNNEIARVTNINEDIQDIYIIAAKNGLYGLYRDDKKIVENQYNSLIHDQLNNVYIAEKNKKFGVVDSEGKEIVGIKYSKIDVNGIYIYSKDENGDVIDIYNKMGVKQNTDLAGYIMLQTDVNNVYIRINQKETPAYQLIDNNNNAITRKKYTYIGYLKNEYFVSNDGNIGVISKDGNQIIENKYDSIEAVKNILIAIDSKKSSTIFSSNMQEVLVMENMKYIEEEKHIKVYNDTETIYLDKDGKILKNTDVIESNAYAKKEEDGTFNVVDKNGNKIGSESYEKVIDSNIYGFMGYKKDGLWGVMDNNGNIILDPTYKLEENIEPSFVGKYIMVEYGFGEINCTNK